MTRERARSAARAGPEEMLRKATTARTPVARAKYARRGLAEGRLDTTTRAMLLRQLYLAHMEGRRFAMALAAAREMVPLGVLEDVARQDVARAHLALGEVGHAVEEIRVASRVSPPSRRAFHLWTLGSVLYLHGRAGDAAAVFARAARWGTHDKALYLAQRALALVASGQQPAESLSALREIGRAHV